jgi:hypothetical protein
LYQPTLTLAKLFDIDIWCGRQTIRVNHTAETPKQGEFLFLNSNPQFWEKFQSVLGSQRSIVPPCKISLGGPGTKCWQIITFCNGPYGSPSGNFSPGIMGPFRDSCALSWLSGSRTDVPAQPPLS